MSKYDLEINPIARQEVVVKGNHYRFTVLTSQLIRLEYSEQGTFEDLATQIVINRDFPVPQYRVIDKEDNLEIITEHLHLKYNKKKFTKNGLSIQVKGNLSAYHSIWYYGEKGENLKGTARTLDEADGEIPLEDGLLSRNGFAIIDDSKSLLITEDGWVAPKKEETIDIYFLGYGREYLKCLKTFYKLCGNTPMLPRYALGNWWSRFYPYTDITYKELVEKFKSEHIPFSVAVLDMGWHLTDIDPKYGSGWTGYTWNKEYFRQPEEFLTWLHKEGMHVTLNEHPADGVRGHEEMYIPMAKELGVDYQKEDKILFDISDRKFLNAYFKYLHHPNEEIGVDFWWVDWQQGGTTKIEGLDPLWMLNHYHFLNSGRDGKRPMTFSRYAGLGSHRYPVGFSGDSFATWETLEFQPYFTATASNAGYGWWSHDIGGHMHGVKSDEMLVRWIQFGVFSPIMRIHSSDNPFFVKEPWKFNPYIGETLKNFLRLRHQIIPYLYTMNYKFARESMPLIRPMYYHNTEEEEAYQVPNQYYFGTELIVCPITKPMDMDLNMGAFEGWLPEGIYYDFFSGRVYKGNRRITFYRDITTIPVLAKAGGIIPMETVAKVANAANNPEDIAIKIFGGADGNFMMYEDNSDDEQNFVLTNMEFKWGKQAQIIIDGVFDEWNVIPKTRNYEIAIAGVADTYDIQVDSEGRRTLFEKVYQVDNNTLLIKVQSVDTDKRLTIHLGDINEIIGNNIENQVFHMLDKAQIDYDLKSLIYQIVRKHVSREQLLAELQTLQLKQSLLGALYEIIAAY
ncbi:alpha-glucosidase (family GH31 glycosyl hydrolase) [Mobilisporobacter senegalensis]|uniref:Alpha-glucosidase (Family GH31 glycosyl hydrolase) n=1 Tax=Mobilisporobacter senegalensis TaxID=1329262 RepID=A0A3N1XL31_9FIRM|nr:TIM-barrel domain-containing protein [Mobilisporobacter senegalensis]ROR27419.1 alpha-glucosidase (family GH31 glycosyl hydrolase) [Mobilisporobacter senegalensis]